MMNAKEKECERKKNNKRQKHIICFILKFYGYFYDILIKNRVRIYFVKKKFLEQIFAIRYLGAYLIKFPH